jgi:hypothetical protein
MPDGTKGRGFINGQFTWSFRGNAINQIHDDSLIIAYIGWMGVFPAFQSGKMTSDFASEREEALYLVQKETQGYSNVQIRERYKLGSAEFYELLATFKGQSVRVAGNTQTEIGFSSSQPEYHLPPIYFLFGQTAAKNIQKCRPD